MERGVSVEQVRRAVKLAQRHDIRVGMFLMWGYEGEEIEDIAATVEHVKESNPDIFFTTVSYPIKGTPYFEAVKDKVQLPIAWAEASDRDYFVGGRYGRDYYRLADIWLRNEVEASRLARTDPDRAAGLMATALEARHRMGQVTAKVGA
jgi:anaerobic magnesium-protoporphyrin IX monomethyl ester cyclase